VDRSRSIAPRTGCKLDRIIIGFPVVAVVILLADRFVRSPLISEETNSPPKAVSGIQKTRPQKMA
jgi:hypothetical protein